ncbi:HAMP domain-containing protein [Paenibacillus albidus]|nr:HAMP domain-containing protein [Paenibacillus albidus]
MKRHSVVTKLFIVTTTLILLVFSGVLVAAGVFFEHFYRVSKIEALDKSTAELARQLGLEPLNEAQFSRRLGVYMNENDSSMSILDESFARIPYNPYHLELQTGTKQISIHIPREEMAVGDIPQGIRAGDRLVVDGIFMDEKDSILQPVVFLPANMDPEEGLLRVSGTVTELLLPKGRSYNPLYQDTLMDEALNEFRPQVEHAQSRLAGGSIMEMEWQDKWSGVNYAVLIRSLPEDHQGTRYLMVMTSLQPVGEAVEILKNYVVYLAPVIAVAVVILSFIYSRLVSRPLLTLNRSAQRLAQLDFSEPPKIQSKDEFGELSRNMTVLSRNLDAALQELTRANEQLQEDVEQKLRSEQLRKELIANISHELKTPLGIVKGFAEGLQDGVASDKKERYLELIVNETDRMNALIMDMLELSKYEAKAIRLRLASLSLKTLIYKVADSFTEQLERKQLALKHDTLEAEGLFVAADPRRIEQVILNLLSNATRHAAEHSVITVRIKQTSPGILTTVIENTGPSIAEEDLGRIWDHFYRTERSRDRKSGGTGLGLAIVKHILELHESEYGVSNTDSGVAFHFTLRIDKGDTHE